MLIVDDDERQLRSLSRLFSAADTPLDISTAPSALAAMARLQKERFDVVLTDIQMAEMDGLELVAWLLSHQPHVTAFTMTAFPDTDAVNRLRELGCIECFTKPVDVQEVTSKVMQTLREGVRGHIRNFSLAAFLQLVEMERKTCTLRVISGLSVGHLYFDHGVLLEARCGSLDGDDAALEIMTWPQPEITIISTCDVTTRTIRSSASFFIMEALRLQDEASQDSYEVMLEDEDIELSGADWGDWGDEASGVERTQSIPPPAAPASAVHSGLSEFPPALVGNAEIIALVDLASGKARFSERRPELEPLVRMAADVYRMKGDLVTKISEEHVQEIAMLSSRLNLLVRPLPYDAERVVVLIFDGARHSLAMGRVQMQRVVERYSTP